MMSGKLDMSSFVGTPYEFFYEFLSSLMFSLIFMNMIIRYFNYFIIRLKECICAYFGYQVWYSRTMGNRNIRNLVGKPPFFSMTLLKYFLMFSSICMHIGSFAYYIVE